MHVRALGKDRWPGRRGLAQGRLAAPTTFLRRYDEHGLLVEEKREPNGIVGSASTRWERDERGVPRAVVQNGQRVDQSCLLPLARYFR